MKTKLPQGFQDYIGTECTAKAQIEDGLSKICESYGYERIQTAALEYMSNFSGQHGSLTPCRMFKTTDRDGELLVARPDATLQVSRIVADKFSDCELKRFYYVTDTFVADSKDYNRELAQVGVELIGSNDIDSDVEVIELAVKFCLAVGLKDFQIEIGNINYFYGFVKNMGCTDAEAETLRDLINKKDMIGVSVLLQNKGLTTEAVEKINRLPLMFGGEEILTEAKNLADNEESLQAVERLQDILEQLKLYGFDKYITVDFGMVKTNNYYSGLVLRGITKSLGHSFIDGGRYDRLCNNYGIEKPAVGLSLWMKRLLLAIDGQDGLKSAPIADVCVVCTDPKNKKTAHDYIERSRQGGIKTVRYFGSEKQATQYCSKNNIQTLAVCDQTGVRECTIWKN